MWSLIRDWLLLNTVLNGPADTRRKLHAADSTGRSLGRGLALLAWWGLLVLCLVGVVASLSGALDGSQAGLSRTEFALTYAGVAVVLLVLRWLWRALRRAGRWQHGSASWRSSAAAQTPGRLWPDVDLEDGAERASYGAAPPDAMRRAPRATVRELPRPAGRG